MSLLTDVVVLEQTHIGAHLFDLLYINDDRLFDVGILLGVESAAQHHL